MDRVTAIVVKLENGRYRRLKLGRIKSIYTDQAHMCAGSIQPGEDDVAGPETKEPDFSPENDGDAVSSMSGNGGDGENGDPICYVVNGVVVCT